MTKDLLTKIQEIEEKAGKNWLQIIRNVVSKEDLVKTATKWGIELTREQAEEGYMLLKSEAKVLTESELSEVSGGIIYK
ncbi:MAG TPA: bacteriocin [Thermotogota bacterium]|nr:bacteriocin [Thermotogota bacterium]HQQ64643.1 bacteriocin [Thermotogota bacterium]